MSEDLTQPALAYHREPKPGKLAIAPTKPLSTQRDLALAYSPGVAAACRAIADDEAESYALTTRGNLVAVVSNGTAVLGLGNIGPHAAKPVMEGKAVLFKKFAGIDVFDLEIAETDPERLVDIVAALEPTFGAVNLEDIKAPECFVVEQKLKARMGIPVFHDDQHGTAIVVGAALVNGLRVVDKAIGEVKLVSTGGGAAGVACLDLFVSMGLKRENVYLYDIHGLVYEGREVGMDPYKARFARPRDEGPLGEAMAGADVFLGLSAPNVLAPEMVEAMAERPLILALANPEPEIAPEAALAARPDAVIATGRSDYPNQVNNVLCFPFIFRGALDVGATTINREMELAAVHAIADLALAETSEVVDRAYGGEVMRFGPDYLIPRPFDPRLLSEVAAAVAGAAMASGVATRPIADFEEYHARLRRQVFRSGLLMKPVFEHAKQSPKRLVYAEGEDNRVLRATQVVLDEGLAMPILIGRPEVVARRVERLGLRFRPGSDVEVVNPEQDPRYRDYWERYHALMERKGVTPAAARTIVRTNNTVIAALMLDRGEADALLCGTDRQYEWHLRHLLNVIGKADGVKDVSALSALILSTGTYFIADTYVTPVPDVQEIVEMTLLSAEQVRRFGLTPKVALLSHTNFGSTDTESSAKMSAAVALLAKRAPELEVEGEMQADLAIDAQLRARIFPNSHLEGSANLLIMPTLDAANIAFNLVKALGEAQPVGPMLLGLAKSAHVVTRSVTARGLVNMTALAVVDAQSAPSLTPRGAATDP